MNTKKTKDIFRFIGILLLLVIITFSIHNIAIAKSKSIEPPENISVQRQSATSIKVKWSKSDNVDGYIIYRYNKKTKKYNKVKQIANKNRRSWIDKNLKTGKVYRYKVASYKKVKGKRKKSKKSYDVSAIAHTKNSKKVNALAISMYANSDNEMGICSDLKISANIIEETSKKTLYPAIISSRLVWTSSDKTIARVDENGRVISMEKEGSCYITARAHNGVKEKVKINVVNYARPRSFPYYKGGIKYVDLMLTTYKENVFNITTYFTTKRNNEMNGTIKLDDNGKITGYPNYNDIEAIQNDVQVILEKFPLVTEIQYSGQDVCFFMKYDKYGNTYCKINYYAKKDMQDNPSRIASHWTATTFAPN